MVSLDMHDQRSLVPAVLATHVTILRFDVLEPLHPKGHSCGGHLVLPGRHQHRASQRKGGHLGLEGGVRVAGQGGRARAGGEVLGQAVLAALGLGTLQAGVLLHALVAGVAPHAHLVMSLPLVLYQGPFLCIPERT